VTTDKNPVPAPDPAPSGAHEALARLRGIVQTVHDDTFSNRCHEEQDVCSLTRHVCADVLAEIDKLLAAEKLTAAAGGEEVIEMRRCEIPYLVLRAGPLYRFSDAPGCEKCAAYADLKQPLCGAHPAIAPYFVRRADVLLRLKAEAERDALKQAAERAGREAALKGLRAVEDDLQKQRPWTQVMQNLKGYIAALQAPQGPGAANRLPVVDDEDGAGGAEQGDERDEKPEPEFDMDAPMVADEAYVRDLHKTTSRRGNGGGYMLHPDEIVCSRDELAKLCESWLSLAKKPEPASAPSAEAVDAMIRSRDAEIARLNEALRASAAGGNGAARAVAELSKLYRRSWKGGVAELDKAIYDRLQELRAEQSEAQPPAVPAGAVEPVTFKSLPVGAYFLLGAWKGRKVEPIMASNGTWTNYRHSGGADWLDPGTKVVPLAAPATSAPSAPEPAGDGDVIRRHLNGMEGAARDTAEWRYYTSGLWPDSPGARCLRPGGASDVVS
jgi:hypothetical protein